MSMFYCLQCDAQRDADHIDCIEDPDNDGWLMCEIHRGSKPLSHNTILKFYRLTYPEHIAQARAREFMKGQHLYYRGAE